MSHMSSNSCSWCSLANRNSKVPGAIEVASGGRNGGASGGSAEIRALASGGAERVKRANSSAGQVVKWPANQSRTRSSHG